MTDKDMNEMGMKAMYVEGFEAGSMVALLPIAVKSLSLITTNPKFASSFDDDERRTLRKALEILQVSGDKAIDDMVATLKQGFETKCVVVKSPEELRKVLDEMEGSDEFKIVD